MPNRPPAATTRPAGDRAPNAPPSRPAGLPHAADALHRSPVPAGRVLARLSRHIDAALAGVGLSPAQYRVLCNLAEPRDPNAASVLADRLAVSRPAITALVDTLVGKHLVERRPSADDRRRVDHVLTETGRRTLDEADAAIDDRLAAVLSHLPVTGIDSAVRGLDRWGAALDRTLAAFLSEPPP